jgi:hypothetical protein
MPPKRSTAQMVHRGAQRHGKDDYLVNSISEDFGSGQRSSMSSRTQPRFSRIASRHAARMSLTTYLLVRDADGAILGEFDSGASVAAVLEQSDELDPGVSVVSRYDSPGAIVGTTALVKAQLADLPTAADPRRGALGRSSDRGR